MLSRHHKKVSRCFPKCSTEPERETVNQHHSESSHPSSKHTHARENVLQRSVLLSDVSHSSLSAVCHRCPEQQTGMCKEAQIKQEVNRQRGVGRAGTYRCQHLTAKSPQHSPHHSNHLSLTPSLTHRPQLC